MNRRERILNSSEPPGLYVHVPFCRTKCPYCDFASVTTLSLVPSWLEALKEEAHLYSGRFAAFDSLYLGGGTPSLLGEQELEALMETLHRWFAFAADAEVTVEVNPDDVTPEKVSMLRRFGFNRVSVGVQSFDEGELRFLGRRHTAQQADRALERIRSAGFTNVGIDLMYAFEGQSEASWMQTLRRALLFRPEHLSCYQMTLEEGTPFGKMRAEGRIHALGESRESVLYLATSRFLEDHGYIHYEISNFARGPECMSRHNRKYWRHVPTLGLGPAAHSYHNGVRWWNVRSVEAYCRRAAEGVSPVEESETLTDEQWRLETLYLGFRTRDGVALQVLEALPGSDSVLTRLKHSGLVEIEQGRVIPTRKGFAVADSLPLLFDLDRSVPCDSPSSVEA